MRWFVPLLLPGSVAINVTQPDQLGQSGDFRVNDRPERPPPSGLQEGRVCS